MKLVIGSDHAGFNLKATVIEYLKKNFPDIEVENVGTNSIESADYPTFSSEVATRVANKEFDKGIVICGSGIGVSIVANKINGVRCGLIYKEGMAKQSVSHNDINVIALGERNIEEKTALKIVEEFITTSFSKEERHIRRIKMISNIEKTNK